MRLSTIISLGASTVLGVGALIAARLLAPSHHPTPPAQATVESVPVVAAAIAIPYGATLDPHFLKVLMLPPGAAPTGAYSSESQILNQPGGAPIAVAAMSPQEPVLPNKLSGPGERFTLAAVIGADMRAFTIGVTEVSGVGGHVMPGDRVDVVMTRDVTPPAAMGAGGRKFVSSVVIQNARVLGMGLNANPTSTEAAVTSTATLEVNVTDAEKLALAGQAGTLTLALRRTGVEDVAPVRPVLVSDLTPGDQRTADAAGLREGQHRRARRRGGLGAVRRASDITVVNGEASTSVSVPTDGIGAGA